MYKIAHFNSHLGGGAAVAARRLHDTLCQKKVQSTFYYLNGDCSNKTYVKNPFGQNINILNRFRRRFYTLTNERSLRGRPDWLELFSFPKLFTDTSIRKLHDTPDIIHLHWITFLVDFPTFFNSISDEIPIVWTLHDMNPFTGGCHYAWTCENFQKGCGNCFQIGRPASHDISYINLKLKKQLYNNKNLHVVADSHWLENLARSSSAFNAAKSIQTIHYGIDVDLFYPNNRFKCKNTLGIDPRKFVIVFGAEDVSNRRKGLQDLLTALSFMDKFNLVLLTFGKGQVSDLPEGVVVKHLGNIDSSDLLTCVYSAADLFVIPSIYEAFGQTALEAMACGTPVIGYDTGGIPDMVVPGENGLLAKRGNPEDLAFCIKKLRDNQELRLAMGKNARARVEERFNLEIQANKYLGLYQRILNLVK